MGYRQRRLRGRAYDELVEAFVQGVREVFPRAVIQWEDFAKERAFDLLERYQKRTPCFNDDIQGTAAVALAGILAALRITRQPLSVQRLLFIGAGEACIGIARLTANAMLAEGATVEDVARAIVVFDSKGLLHEGRTIAERFKRHFAVSKRVLDSYGLVARAGLDPVAVIRAFEPTVLVGATAQPGTFTKEMIREMAKHVERPLVMALSNPTAKSECSPKEAIEWSGGRALVATGSPFGDVVYEGRRYAIGQANNVFVFPGVGLGAVVSEARELDDETFSIAARALARCVSPERLELGAIYPPQDQLREV